MGIPPRFYLEHTVDVPAARTIRAKRKNAVSDESKTAPEVAE